MEQYICTQDCKIGLYTKHTEKREIKKGDKFPVLRDINGNCVLIINKERTPNIIAKEQELRKYGDLIGIPSYGGV